MRIALALVVLVGASACAEPEPTEHDLGPAPEHAARDAAAPGPTLNPRLIRRFRPLRRAPGIESEAEAARVELGRALFEDQRLSRHGLTSCRSCHELSTNGADQLAVSRGDDGVRGVRNSPSVFNSAPQIAQFWDGRATTLDNQAREPLLVVRELGMGSEAAVLARLVAAPEYEPLFEAAFPDQEPAITFAHTTAALARFEQSLVTPSRWDDYLRGDHSALTAQEQEGMKLFADVGCVQCHTGELIGGSMFQQVGRAESWPTQTDLGRFEITQDPMDRMAFKVPSLRNVTRTAPYFHDGSVADLRVAVHMMGRYQLGEELTEGQVASIVDWFGALAGSRPVSQ